MQKNCLLAFSLLIFLLSFNTSFAKDLMATSSSKAEINYELPYPGLLPDNPLYFLRIIRDKTINFLIADPLKKAEFNLLQADKRLNAGIYLFNKGKSSLALSTISKAENYFEQAIGKAKEARKEGVAINEIARKLISSSKKHQEVIGVLKEKFPPNFKSSFDLQLQRVNGFIKEAVSLTLK